METVIFLGWAGVGKTTLAAKYPGSVVDLESSAYKWMEEPSEANKGRQDRTLNPAYPANYKFALMNLIGNVPIICAAFFGLEEFLLANDVRNVYTVTPATSDIELYRQKYADRGNRASFYANLDEIWDVVAGHNAVPTPFSIVLPSGWTLENYLRSDRNITGAKLAAPQPIRIYFDSDDVLMESTEPAIKRYNEDFGGSFCLEQLTEWGMDNCVPEGTTIEHYYDEPGFYRAFQPLPGMVALVTRLKEAGHKLYVATSCSLASITEKVESLEEHYPFRWDDAEIIPIKDKFLLEGDVFVDDKVENVVYSRCRHKLLVDRPWNQGYFPGVIRVKGVDELSAALDRILVSEGWV